MSLIVQSLTLHPRSIQMHHNLCYVEAQDDAQSLIPRTGSLSGIRGLDVWYLRRYTVEIRNPVMKMNEGVRNRKYLYTETSVLTK